MEGRKHEIPAILGCIVHHRCSTPTCTLCINHLHTNHSTLFILPIGALWCAIDINFTCLATTIILTFIINLVLENIAISMAQMCNVQNALSSRMTWFEILQGHSRSVNQLCRIRASILIIDSGEGSDIMALIIIVDEQSSSLRNAELVII